jgi:hypothetical protein
VKITIWWNGHVNGGSGRGAGPGRVAAGAGAFHLPGAAAVAWMRWRLRSVQGREDLVEVELGDLRHGLPLRVVAVEQPERAGHQGQVHREPV